MRAQRGTSPRRRPIVVMRDAAIIAGLCAAVAVSVNAARSDGIPLVADAPYEILVPCPEPVGEVDATAPAAAIRTESGTLVVDAREAAAFAAWHLPDARNVVFDWLEPLADDTASTLVSSGARRIVVYGDGADPDSGRELARELAGRGLRNVTYVDGGAPALRAALGLEPDPGEGPR